jgi:excisionase family DNA binding protein
MNAQHREESNSLPNPVPGTASKAAIDAVLTVAEVACELRCSKGHVYNLINGDVADVTPLPTISLGRKKLIRRSSFEAWKRANEKNVPDGTLGAKPVINTVDA